tara:strand:- start:9648 stop:9794 length:147 start_codon:yes stop_codon:yes gene_type:complete
VQDATLSNARGTAKELINGSDVDSAAAVGAEGPTANKTTREVAMRTNA